MERTLQEKAEAILHITLECGCPATWSGIFEGYEVDGEHTCDGSVLKQQRQAQREERYQHRVEAVQRLDMPLNGQRGFRLLR